MGGTHWLHDGSGSSGSGNGGDAGQLVMVLALIPHVLIQPLRQPLLFFSVKRAAATPNFPLSHHPSTLMQTPFPQARSSRRCRRPLRRRAPSPSLWGRLSRRSPPPPPTARLTATRRRGGQEGYVRGAAVHALNIPAGRPWGGGGGGEVWHQRRRGRLVVKIPSGAASAYVPFRSGWCVACAWRRRSPASRWRPAIGSSSTPARAGSVRPLHPKKYRRTRGKKRCVHSPPGGAHPSVVCLINLIIGRCCSQGPSGDRQETPRPGVLRLHARLCSPSVRQGLARQPSTAECTTATRCRRGPPQRQVHPQTIRFAHPRHIGAGTRDHHGQPLMSLRGPTRGCITGLVVVAPTVGDFVGGRSQAALLPPPSRLVRLSSPGTQ